MVRAVRTLRTWGAVPIALGTMALGFSACGGGEGSTGSLASAFPDDTLFYMEATIRPEGDARDAIESVASRFPGGEDLGETIVDELDEQMAEADPGDDGDGDPPTWEDDVEPWLGSRVALGFSSLEETPEGDPPFVAIFETTDADAAAEAIPELAEEESPDERTDSGTSYYVDGDEVVGVVEGFLVLTDTEDAFLRTRDTIEGTKPTLQDSQDFTYDVAGEDAAEALGFLWMDLSTLFDQAIAADPTAEFSPEQFDQVMRATGFDLDTPIVASLGATEDQVTLDTSAGALGGDDAPADPAQDAALLESVPADASLAASLSGTLNGFREGFQLGLEQAAAADGVEDPSAILRERLGIDVEEVANALGGGAFFLRGESVFEIGGAAIVEVEDRDAIARALDGARRVVERSSPDVSIQDLPGGLPGNPEGFTVSPGGAGGLVAAPSEAPVPVSVNVALTEDRLVVGFGEDSTVDALAPEETLGESGAVDFTEAIGDDYAPDFVADMDALAELIGTIPNADAAVPYLEPMATIVSGSRLDGDDLLTRTVASFD